MIDFIEYVVSELKQRRLSRADALALVQDYARRGQVWERLHPMLERNASDLQGLRYLTLLQGDEHFLADHRCSSPPTVR